jgi:hypothetical protein
MHQAAATNLDDSVLLSPTGNLSAWVATLGVCLLVIGGLALGQGALLRLAYPAAAFGVGVYLYWKHPVQYICFTWWVWMLSPFVRRLIDWQSGPVDPSPALLAPVLVSFVAGVGLLRYGLQSVREGGGSFIFAVAGVIYGLGVGLLRNNFDYKLAQPLLIWLAPIFIGFHFFIHWREYPHFRRVLQRTFVWGALVLGAYGVVQFLATPAWDIAWLDNIQFLSFGSPNPLEIRVFSTLNAPGPFAVVMMAALLLLFSARGWLRFPAAVVGYLSFLLCITRSAWMGWAIGLSLLLLHMNLRARLRVLVVIAVLATAVVPLALLPPFAEVVLPRFESLTTPKQDVSVDARLAGYGRYLHDALMDPLGKGIGVMEREYKIGPDDEGIGGHDSAILELLLSLGFPGTACYGLGLALLLGGLRPRYKPSADGFYNVTRAIRLAMFVQLLSGSVMLGVMGVVLWGVSRAALLRANGR